MKESELIIGNGEICKMLGWESNKAYVYKVPNLFPSNEDSGYTEFDTQNVGFNLDWNILIGAYNIALQKIVQLSETKKELLDKNFIVQFGTKNFFHLFDNQLSINSCWNKLVDFSKWYNSLNHIK